MTDTTSLGTDFFSDLFRRCSRAVAALPLTLEPASMAYITEVLEPAARAGAAGQDFGEPPDGLVRERTQAIREATDDQRRNIGLNTIGLLLDRLSILSVKHWNLLHRTRSSAKAEDLIATQIAELVAALSIALPGLSSVNNKLTTHRVQIRAESFSQACYGLVTTNTLLWEAQETLYNHDIAALPDAALRAYIRYFSRGNLERNAYIAACDALYWAPIMVD